MTKSEHFSVKNCKVFSKLTKSYNIIRIGSNIEFKIVFQLSYSIEL